MKFVSAFITTIFFATGAGALEGHDKWAKGIITSGQVLSVQRVEDPGKWEFVYELLVEYRESIFFCIVRNDTPLKATGFLSGEAQDFSAIQLHQLAFYCVE